MASSKNKYLIQDLVKSLLLSALMLSALTASAYVEIADSEIDEWKSGASIIRITDGNITAEDCVPGSLFFISGFSEYGAEYYLLLPKSYDPNNPPPVIVSFSASPSGLGCIMRWAPSVEQFGWAVVSVHGHGNRPGLHSKERIYDTVEHFRSFLPHNRARVYSQGLSGGCCKAFAMARHYWNEIAGVINIVGWQCNYSDYCYFPERLAVVHFLNYKHKQRSGIIDEKCIEDSGARQITLVPNVGHTWPPPSFLDQTLEWLNEDFEKNAHKFIPPDADATALELTTVALQAIDEGDYELATTNALEVVVQYAFTPSCNQALDLLVELYENDDVFPTLVVDHFEKRTDWSRALTQRSYQFSHMNNRRYARGMAEWAVLLDPTFHLALDQLVYCINRQEELQTQELLRATELNLESCKYNYTHYRVWNQRGRLALRKGSTIRVQDSIERAISNCYEWYNEYRYLLRTVDETQRRLEELPDYNTELPFFTYFYSFPTNVPFIDCGQGFNPAFSVRVTDDEANSGQRSLALNDENDVLRLNIPTDDDQPVWVDLYLMPSLSDVAPELLFTDNPLNFFVDENQQLCLLDHSGNEPEWLVLEETRLPGDRWSRLSYRIDFSNGTFSVWLNDRQVAEDFVFPVPEITSFISLNGYGAAPYYIDHLAIQTEKPLPDWDNDTLPDSWETEWNLDHQDSGITDKQQGADGDPDKDGLPNFLEYRSGTDPFNADSDGDGMTDGDEYFHGQDPTDPNAYPQLNLPAKQSFADYLEEQWNTDRDARPGVDPGMRHLQLYPSRQGGGLSHMFASGPKTVIWLELTLQPVPGESITLTDEMRKGTALLYLNTDGYLVAYDGTPAVQDWKILTNRQFPLNQWITVTLRLDYRSQTWSVWHESYLLADQLGFANRHKRSFSKVEIRGSALLDDFSASPHGPDRDGDRIPDDWEQVYFGTVAEADAGSDADNDGFPDESEYLAGTDPLDPESLLRINSVRMEGDRLILNWQAKQYNYEGNPISYRLLRSDSLMKELPPPVAVKITTEKATCEYCITNNLDAVKAFFFVEAEP